MYNEETLLLDLYLDGLMSADEGTIAFPVNLPKLWQQRIPKLFPQYVRHPMGERHINLWDWANEITMDSSPRPYVAIWPRGGGKSTSVELMVCDLGLRRARQYVWYVCANQDSADRHVSTISKMLQSQNSDPLLSSPKVSKTGNRRWNRQQIITDTGFAVESIGLDKAVRGGKIDWARPDLIIFDDIDEKHDTQKIIAKKRETMTTSILPAAATNGASMFVQNLIHANSIASELANTTSAGAGYMLSRIVSGAYVAVEGLKTEFRYNEKYERNMPYIIEGVATWEGQPLEVCQRQMWEWGLSAFLKESQHEVINIGSFFKREWFDDAIIDEFPSGCDAFVRYWDNASSSGRGDYTAGVLMARKGGTYFVIDVARGQWETDKRRTMQLRTAELDLSSSEYRNSETGQEQEPGSSGVDAAADFMKAMKEHRPFTEKVTGAKPVRAEPFKIALSQGNVKLVRGSWNREYIEELTDFTENNTHREDGQVDASSGAFNRLSKSRRGGLAGALKKR